MSPGKKLKRKCPSLSRPSNPQQDFEEACDELQLKVEHHMKLRALAVRFLQDHHHFVPGVRHNPCGISPISDTVPFLEAFGPALFPSHTAYRHHLVDAVHTKGHQCKFRGCRDNTRGPVYGIDSQLTYRARALWRRASGGAEPGREDEVANSKLGQVVTRLLQAVLEFMQQSLVASESRSQSVLLEAIIGRAGDHALPAPSREIDTHEMQFSRYPSPETQLVEDMARLQSQIVQPKRRKRRKLIAPQPAAPDVSEGPSNTAQVPETSQHTLVDENFSQPTSRLDAPLSEVHSIASLPEPSTTSPTSATPGQDPPIPTRGEFRPFPAGEPQQAVQDLPIPSRGDFCAFPAEEPQHVVQDLPVPTRGDFCAFPTEQSQHAVHKLDLVQQHRAAIDDADTARSLGPMPPPSGFSNNIQRLRGSRSARPKQAMTIPRSAPPSNIPGPSLQVPMISPLACHDVDDTATSSFVFHNTSNSSVQVVAMLPEVKALPPAAWKLPTCENTRKPPNANQWGRENCDRVLALRAATGWLGGLPVVRSSFNPAMPRHRGFV